jgi:hypothetical protein
MKEGDEMGVVARRRRWGGQTVRVDRRCMGRRRTWCVAESLEAARQRPSCVRRRLRTFCARLQRARPRIGPERSRRAARPEVCRGEPRENGMMKTRIGQRDEDISEGARGLVSSAEIASRESGRETSVERRASSSTTTPALSLNPLRAGLSHSAFDLCPMNDA